MRPWSSSISSRCRVSSIQSRPKRELVANVTALARIGKLYELPTVLSTVNVKTGRNQPTIHQITDVLDQAVPLDRTSINAWQDEDFVRAVKATGRRKLIMAALWTEVCLVHPALDAIAEGFEVYPVIDCVGGTSPEAHELGVLRLVQAGGPADELGAAHLRTAARLEPGGDHGRLRRHPVRRRGSLSGRLGDILQQAPGDALDDIAIVDENAVVEAVALDHDRPAGGRRHPATMSAWTISAMTFAILAHAAAAKPWRASPERPRMPGSRSQGRAKRLYVLWKMVHGCGQSHPCPQSSALRSRSRVGINSDTVGWMGTAQRSVSMD